MVQLPQELHHRVGVMRIKVARRLVGESGMDGFPALLSCQGGAKMEEIAAATTIVPKMRSFELSRCSAIKGASVETKASF